MGIKCNFSGMKNVVAKYGDVGKANVAVGVVDNPEIATYATYNEYGWVQRVTGKQAAYLRANYGMNLKVGTTLMSPPRPFMRATYAAKIGEWNKILQTMLKGNGLTDPRKALEIVGRQAQVDIQETIRNGGVDGTKFPERSPMTLAMYEAKDSTTSSGRKRKIEADSGSARGKPLFRSGKLFGAIGYEVRGA